MSIPNLEALPPQQFFPRPRQELPTSLPNVVYFYLPHFSVIMELTIGQTRNNPLWNAFDTWQERLAGRMPQLEKRPIYDYHYPLPDYSYVGIARDALQELVNNFRNIVASYPENPKPAEQAILWALTYLILDPTAIRRLCTSGDFMFPLPVADAVNVCLGLIGTTSPPDLSSEQLQKLEEALTIINTTYFNHPPLVFDPQMGTFREKTLAELTKGRPPLNKVERVVQWWKNLPPGDQPFVRRITYSDILAWERARRRPPFFTRRLLHKQFATMTGLPTR